MYIYPQSRFLVILCQPLCISVVFPRVCMLLLVSVKQVTNFMVAVKEPVVVFETKDGGFLFGNYLFFHYDRKSSTPYMSVEMRSGLYPQSLIYCVFISDCCLIYCLTVKCVKRGECGFI